MDNGCLIADHSLELPFLFFNTIQKQKIRNRADMSAVRAVMAMQNCLQAESTSEFILSVRNGEMSDIGGTEPSFGVPETFRPFRTNSSISHATAGRVQERGRQSATFASAQEECGK